MISFKAEGDWSKTDGFLEKALEVVHLGNLDKYGKMGVEALEKATPVYTGLASSSWYYEIERHGDTVELIWCNSDIENGKNVIDLLVNGHSTKRGTFVQGNDFITPALEPVFNEIIEGVGKEVKSL